ncbi:C-type lectin domain family 4 member F-like isoform X2 [Mauremys reevesii]|uniref:C-type lectin domain family 4 member F-like isoform X2 n=1 Tax=Mauremys reevesii TaxID=260615 RepID=UPI00193F0640|nr:C-type lectin domain family 4 member F-like isoform X2 [Mauremys reevesii]
MADKKIYMNVNIGKPPLQSPAKPPETPAAPSRKTSDILCALPVVLSVALGISLIAVTVMYFQGQKRLRDVEEAVHKIRASLQPTTTLDTSKELDTLQLLDEVQAGVRMLKAQLGDVLTKLSRGWRLYSGNLYYFSQERKSWDEAEQFCVSQDSHLTSVSSQAEQEFISSETQGEDHWIGLTDRETEGSWRWVDGTEYRADASRGFWGENEPNNYDPEKDGGEDCVHTEPRKRNLWNDANCTQPFRWICKGAHGQAGL